MANIVVLDNVSHRQLTVKEDYLLQAQDGLGSIPIFPAELDAAHKEFSIFIRKHSDTGQFFLSALLAPDENDNVYFDHGRWRSRYIPLMARRGPFLMAKANDDDAINMCIDLDDKRVHADGERLFDEHGKPGALTERTAAILNLIHQGHQQTTVLLNALTALNLIEPININTTLSGDSGAMFSGLYSINADKLKRHDTAITALNAAGYLQHAYFIASSASNVIALLERSAIAP